MGEGLSSSLFSPEYCPFRRVSLPAHRDPHILPSASDSHHKLTPIFTTLLGIAGSDNRDFAFILYAWLSYCCVSPLPWFSSFPGISPDFARLHWLPKCPWAPGWQLNQIKAGLFCALWKEQSWVGFKWRRFNWCKRGYSQPNPSQ